MEGNNALQVFNYEGQQVRTVEKDGETWFVGRDVAQALGYSEQSIKQMTVLLAHVPEIWKGRRQISTPGGKQDVLCISEQGLYFFLGRSDKPKALPFQMWLAGEVLPEIRKTGAYVPDKALMDPAFIRGLTERIAAIQQANDELREQIAKDQAATTFGKIMLGMSTGLDFHKAAQVFAQHGFPIGRNKLYQRCREKKWLCEQKKIRNQPTQAAIERGLVGWQPEFINGKCEMIVVLSQKALSLFADELTKEFTPIVYLIDREESKAQKKLEGKQRHKQKALKQ